MVEMKICPTCGTEYEPKERFCPRDGTALRTQGGVSDLVGQVVADRYHVLRKLGEGGMGQVYLAEHVKMGRKSALKVMHPSMGSDPDAISRFNREAANASRINHPNVASIYDFGETPDGLIYLAMEYVEGQPLTALVEELGALPVRRVADIVVQAASALQAAHDLGIVHRDLKPDNIMITRNRDGSDCVKVVDFGIAKAGAEGNQKVTRTGLVVGTPEYMSPEQLAGDKLDGRSDVYSLGLVTFNLLTGALPFPSDSAQESMIMRLTDRPRTLAETRPDVTWPASLQVVMDRVLSRPVAERYQNAPEYGRDLSRALADIRESALNPDGTLVMSAAIGASAAAGGTVPPTRVAGGGRVSAPSTAAPRSAPAARERSRAPLFATAGVLGVVLLAGTAWLATREKDAAAAIDTGSALASASIPTSTPGASIPDPATATSTPTQPHAQPTATTASVPAGPSTSGTTASAPPPDDAADANAETPGPGTPFAEIGRQMRAAAEDPALAQQLLTRIEANMPPVTRPRQRMVANKLRADLLAALDRRDDACELLQQIRSTGRIYAQMSPQFRRSVELYFEEASGPACQ